MEVETLIGRLVVYTEDRASYRLKPKERLKTDEFLAFEAYLAENTSHRAANEIMNLAARRTSANNNEISVYAEYEDTVRCGMQAEEALFDIVQKTFDASGVKANENAEVEDAAAVSAKTRGIISPMVKVELSSNHGGNGDGYASRITRLADEHNSMQDSEKTKMHGGYSFEKDPESVVYVSVDDVLVHRQKTARKKGSSWVLGANFRPQSLRSLAMTESLSSIIHK